jgi:predicted MPP superfamily phosphohydrolase
MTRRRFIGSAAAMLTSAGLAETSVGSFVHTFDREYFIDWAKSTLNISWPKIADKARFRVIGDTHFNYFDERDKEYASNYARMSGLTNKAFNLPSKSPHKYFEQALSTAKKDGVDAILLVGDILSFPTLANVEYTKSKLDECGVPWFYIAGNHDWHFEGLGGASAQLREIWIKKRLMSLYKDVDNPLMFSRVVKGVRIVAIDNSTYLLTRQQVEFWKSEAAKGDPVVLMMHIPLYSKLGLKDSCASPYWGAAIDWAWKIERRPQWPEKATLETFEFRDAVLSTPNLIGVFTGHVHRAMSMRESGQNMFSVPACQSPRTYLDVTIL